LVKNLYLSLDPAIRGWMNASKNSYLPPVELGDIMRGGSVGVVLESTSPLFVPGQYVNCLLAPGWAQFGIVNPQDLIPIQMRPGIPPRAWAGVLGGTGLTAYFGLLRIGNPKPGETVVVSAAAGAVGSVVCQIAKNVLGCRVIGIAGGPMKCDFLKSRGLVDEACDYKSVHFSVDLKNKIGKSGINVMFDSVGGRILDICLKFLAFHARVILCGAMSQMGGNNNNNETTTTITTTTVEPLTNAMNLIVKSAKMEGFILLNYSKQEFENAFDDISEWIRQGKIMYVEDVIYGLENAPRGLLKLFGVDGGNFGKLVVVLHPDEEIGHGSNYDDNDEWRRKENNNNNHKSML
jgi:NADPH-dependent curcumin reductase CurA